MSEHVEVPSTDEVARFLVELRALGQGEPPAPSPELAALLGGATPLARSSSRRLSRRIVARSALAAAAVVTALVVAAANHDLPQPAQRVVSNVVGVLTPFHIHPGNVAPTTLTPSPSRERDEPPVVGDGADSSSPSEDRPGGDEGTTGSRGSGSGGGGGSDDGSGTGSGGGEIGGEDSGGGGGSGDGGGDG